MRWKISDYMMFVLCLKLHVLTWDWQNCLGDWTPSVTPAAIGPTGGARNAPACSTLSSAKPKVAFSATFKGAFTSHYLNFSHLVVVVVISSELNKTGQGQRSSPVQLVRCEHHTLHTLLTTMHVAKHLECCISCTNRLNIIIINFIFINFIIVCIHALM